MRLDGESPSSNLILEAVAYITNSNNEILPYELEQFPGKNFYQKCWLNTKKRYRVEALNFFSMEENLIYLTL